MFKYLKFIVYLLLLLLIFIGWNQPNRYKVKKATDGTTRWAIIDTTNTYTSCEYDTRGNTTIGYKTTNSVDDCTYVRLYYQSLCVSGWVTEDSLEISSETEDWWKVYSNQKATASKFRILAKGYSDNKIDTGTYLEITIDHGN